MNINELDNFRLAKAISFNDQLNPQIFEGDKMRPLVFNKLMSIAEDFREFLGVEEIALSDITISGSNAAYSYTPHSDIDLHLIVDFSALPQNEVYRELFDAKKYQYNDQHDIKIKGYNVELYVQDSAQPHSSLGEYSLLRNDWNRYPSKQRANLDDTATLLKYEKLKDLAIRALASDSEEYLDSVLNIIKRYRRAGLSEKGEFGPENLAFKMIRTDGLFQRLHDKKRKHEDEKLSLEHAKEVPQDNIAEELAAQFEASYKGNIGAMEVMKFYQIANERQKDVFNRLVKAGRNKEAWQLVQKVTDVKLQGKEFAMEADIDLLTTAAQKFYQTQPQHMVDMLRNLLALRKYDQAKKLIASVTEGVGIITKQNQTVDVGPNQTKIEAAKLHLKVDKGGVPPTLKSNGKTKTVENIMEMYERKLLELKMSPKHVAGQVSKLAPELNPIIGLEFEVCIPSVEGDGNPDVGTYTTLQDVMDFFENNSEEDFEPIRNQYDEWLFEQQDVWAREKAQEAAWKQPQYDSSKIIELMQDHTTDGDFDEWLEKTYDEVSITNDIGKDIIAEVVKYIKRWGEVDDWEDDEVESNPMLKFYYEVFVEYDDAIDSLHQYFSDDFWNQDPYNDDDYSFGAWCLKDNIKNMYDVWREWENNLYWPGILPDHENGSFDENTADMIVSDLQDQGYYAFVSDDVSIESPDDWIVKPDASIKPNNDMDAAIEIAMPPMEYEEGLEAIEWFMDYLDGKGAYTNESTGLHINVSFGNRDIKTVDYVKLALLSGDKKILKDFGREFNEYTRHSMSLIVNAINPNVGPSGDREGKAKKHAVVMSNMKHSLQQAAQALISVSAEDSHQSISIKDNRVEFRSAGGDYLGKFDQILEAINRAVYGLAIASNPESYKKEYAKKLYKLAASVNEEGDETALKIFAAYNAGTIDKERLIQVLKAKRNKPAPVVDTGKPRDEGLEDDEKFIRKIADHYSITDSQAGVLWMEGEQKEYERLNDLDKAREVVYRNLINDIGYYRR